MIEAIIFDLDGTLLNTLDDLQNSTNYALQQCDFPLITKKQTQEFVGNGVAKLIERAIPNGTRNVKYTECLNIFKTHYAENNTICTKPYEGIIELLEALQKRGIKIAVVSNKFDSAVKELCKKYFNTLIDFAIGESFSTQKKPHPDGILKTVETLNVNIKNCLYIGDSEVDIQTAQNVNIACICVTWGYRKQDFLLENGAEKFVNNPCEILEKL